MIPLVTGSRFILNDRELSYVSDSTKIIKFVVSFPTFYPANNGQNPQAYTLPRAVETHNFNL